MVFFDENMIILFYVYYKHKFLGSLELPQFSLAPKKNEKKTDEYPCNPHISQ